MSPSLNPAPSLNPNLPTLFHAKRACSMVARLCAAHGEIDHNLIHVNLTTKEMHHHGTLLEQSFFDINPLGQVSVLRIPNGETSRGVQLTENMAVALWLQSHSHNKNFKRTPDNPDYFHMIKWMSFCSTQLHQQIFRIVFYDEATNAVKDKIRALAPARFETLDTHLADKKFLVGDYFSAADAYLIWVLFLAERAGLDPTPFHHLMRYKNKTMTKPLIQAIIEDDLL